ncbi:MAG: PEGA domain-containing protein [Nitrospinae bacterium]|nr:PEGA domain-containing protein [Nitrospinota bacterium]
MVNLSTIPDKADVYMDKSFIGNTPMAALRIKTGKHLLRIEKKGYVVWEKQIQVFSFNEHNVVVELEKPPIDDAPPAQNPPN